MPRTLTVSDESATELFLALQNSTDAAVAAPVPPVVFVPVVTAPVVAAPEPVVAPAVRVQQVSHAELLAWASEHVPGLAREYSHIIDFADKRPDLATAEAIVGAYQSIITPAPVPIDQMWNAGTGFPVENVSPIDAAYILRRGQQLGVPQWYIVLAGLQSQIGALIQRTEAGNDTVAAMNYDPQTYDGPLLAYLPKG